MIKLRAEIKLISNKNDLLGSADCSIAALSINGEEYGADISKVLGKKIQALNPYFLGEENTNRTLEQKLEYYVGSIFSDENGEFSTAYEITISPKSDTTFETLNSLFISFDTYNNYHPKSIKVYGDDGTSLGEFFDDDTQFEIKVGKKSDGTHYSNISIEIDNWNAPYKPLVVTGIYADITIDVNSDKLISLSGDIVTRADFKMPSYGIVSGGGSIEFNDYNGEISDYADLGLLKSGAIVTIIIEDTLNKTSQQVGVYETEKWTYDAENKTVSVSLVDGLQKLQDINFEGIEYYPLKSKEQYFTNIHSTLIEAVKNQGFQISLSLPNELWNIAFYTKIPKPMMERCSLWNALNIFAEAMLCHIYKNRDGVITFSYNGGG